ncbi:MAG: DUF2283 domain-containing protein [Candidatus Diapherotrites archaeon]
MRVKYDEKADAIYIRFSEEKYFESDEIKEGFILDFDKKCKIIGLEILDVSENLPKEAFHKISFEMAKEKIPAKAIA